MWRVTLFFKPQCSLCAAAKDTILEFQKECDLVLTEVDVTKDPELWKKYGFDIPVAVINEKDELRHSVRLSKLRDLQKVSSGLIKRESGRLWPVRA